MYKNTAGQKVAIFAYDTGGNVPKTGDAGNLTAYVSINGGAVNALADTSGTEMDAANAKGMYLFDVSQAETNGDLLVFTCKSSTSGVQCDPVEVFTKPAVQLISGMVQTFDALLTALATAHGAGSWATATGFATHSAADVAALILATPANKLATDGSGQVTVGAMINAVLLAIANKVEAEIIDETDSEKVLSAITDKIAAVNPDLSGLTLSAIASAVRDALLNRVLAGNHDTAGTAGKLLQALPGSGVLSTVVPATAAEVGLAAAAVIDALPAEPDNAGIAAIQARTDNLPDTPVSADDLATAAEEIIAAQPTAAEIATQVNTTLSGVHGAGSWATLTPEAIRAAIGLAAANLDTQLAAVAAEIDKVPRAGKVHVWTNQGHTATSDTVSIADAS